MAAAPCHNPISVSWKAGSWQRSEPESFLRKRAMAHNAMAPWRPLAAPTIRSARTRCCFTCRRSQMATVDGLLGRKRHVVLDGQRCGVGSRSLRWSPHKLVAQREEGIVRVHCCGHARDKSSSAHIGALTCKVVRRRSNDNSREGAFFRGLRSLFQRVRWVQATDSSGLKEFEEAEEKDTPTESASQAIPKRVIKSNAWSSRNLPEPCLPFSLSETMDGTITGTMALRGTMAGVAAAVAVMVALVPGAQAADLLKTCACLLRDCRLELAECIADPKCAANVACLNSCNNRPDETECQIGCGDLFEDATVDEFNKCAVSEKKCVPKRVDVGLYPVPAPSAVVENFSATDFEGKWFISKGYNPTFDAFDCQLHEFHANDPRSLTAKLQWRITTPDGGFFTRMAIQTFVQDENQPGLLLNHNNEFLHYEDDWYIISAKTEKKPDDYIFVYYRGRNDAWDGYGGAVIYTRSRTVPKSAVPALREAASKVGLDYDKFITTDNSCRPVQPLFARIETKIETEVKKEEAFLEKELELLGDEEKMLFQRLGDGAKELQRDEQLLLESLSEEEKALLKDLQMGASDIEKLFGKALPIRRLR
ncbi:hypothetical protein CBR_g38554 [Chara braunii]|uniref:VDE lipocalin domain-containing protein n=1 Tax=Chara braunii TaxID=69332 RepID=A0A388JNX5_CHABU|nr:hypothetical protein CBR_g38554 [Chara braunii]|eukprot:GBG59530.1 hypothetical protein CBR_g38554 [Chara braunii]